MDPDFAQRRRVAVAVAITVIAVPGFLLLGRQDGSGDTVPPPGVVAPGATVEPPAADRPTATDAMGTTAIDLEARPDAPIVDDPARIAIPRLPAGIEGTASFRSDIANTTVCQVKDAPFNSQVTVTNLDNSKSVQCFAAIRGDDADYSVVMHAEAFLRIADITDAPIPVRITW